MYPYKDYSLKLSLGIDKILMLNLEILLVFLLLFHIKFSPTNLLKLLQSYRLKVIIICQTFSRPLYINFNILINLSEPFNERESPLL